MRNGGSRSDPWRRVVAIAAKGLFGVAVFCGVVAGVTMFQSYRMSRSPLPSSGGREGACVLWFVGSSTIFRWTSMAGDMQPWITHNRGVGGAKIPEIMTRFVNEQGSIPPQAIVFYAGENDMANGATPADAFASFQRFLAAKDAKMPGVPTFVVSLKPSLKRWSLRGQQLAFNAMERDMAARTHAFDYIEIGPALLVDGRPGPYYGPDGLHMNPTGYRLFSRIIRNAVQKGLPAGVVNKCDPPVRPPVRSAGGHA